MKVLMLLRYPRVAASARQRFFDVRAPLTSRGIDSEVRVLFPDDYLQHRFGHPARLLPGILRGYWRRVIDLLGQRKHDLLFIQGECLPYLPAFVERLLLAGQAPYVVDYDDAWFHRYQMHPRRLARLALRDKIARLIERAAAVTVGSTYLRDYASRFNSNVFLLPTSIDLSRYPTAPPERDPRRPFTIGWVGSPGTTVFLQEIDEALRRFSERHTACVTLVGAAENGIQGPTITRVPWSEATEVEALAQIDVGVMPLTDTPFARGKCAFKLIQYMGCWKPVVASPVGENVEVVSPGVNGFLATTTDQWIEAFERLRDDRGAAERMGRQGRARVEERYSLELFADRLVEVFATAIGAPSGLGHPRRAPRPAAGGSLGRPAGTSDGPG